MMYFTRILKYNFLLFLFLFSFSELKAQPSASPQSGCAPLTVTFLSGGASDNQWIFGDGTSVDDKDSASVIYTTPGTYNATFTNIANGQTTSFQIQVFPKPTPNFTTTTKTDSCKGLKVGFEDLSTGGGGSAIVSWSWNFGDGIGLTQQNPEHIYNSTSTPGFTVQLTVVDANGCTNTYADSNLVHISNITGSIFTTPSPASSCTAPFLVKDSTNASSSSGFITNYFWDFGNGNTSNLKVDTTTYFSSGTYTVTLEVIDTFGCHKLSPDIIPKTVLIDNPIADFTFNDLLDNDTVCQTVTFQQTATALGNPTYLWDFGDGTVTNPASTGVTQITNLGSTTSGTYNTPVHTYDNSAPYTQYIVSLTVTTNNIGVPCSNTFTDTIWVDGVRASFTSAPHYSCEMPFVVTYDGSGSINAVQWDWTFLSDTDYAVSGINTASGVIATDTIITIDTNEYTIHWMELFDVQLQVTSNDGCQHDTTINANDTVFKPTAIFFSDTTNGCFPLEVTFYDSSKSEETIAQWFWDFGDGTDSTVTDPDFDSILHTYTQPGVDTVYLIITNDSGCIDTSYSIIINVGGPPNPDFSATPTSVCPGEIVNFSDLTPIADSVDTWHYESDGFHFWSCPNDSSPAYAYVSDVGFFDVTLITGYNGCYSQTTVPNMIEVKGPIASGRYEGNCDTPFLYNFFSDSSKGFTSLSWNFDDPGSGVNNTSILPNPTHTFTATGDYTVILTTINSGTGCPDSKDTIIVRVREIKAVIDTTNLPDGRDTLFCSGVAGDLGAAPSVDVYNYCSRGYRWDWGDGTPPDGTDNPVIQHEFDTVGIVQIRLIVTDTNGCTDTAFQNIIVHTIKADFVMDTTVATVQGDTLLICVPQNVLFVDSTTADTTVVSWGWTSTPWDVSPGGDTAVAASTTIPGNNDTVSFNYSVYLGYPSFGYYQIDLVVTDTLGCTDSTFYFIKQSRPDSAFVTVFSSELRKLCAGDSIGFKANNSNFGTQYLWDFGDGTDTSGGNEIDSIFHIYSDTGKFNVSLTVTDSVGCTGTTILNSTNDYVQVQAYPVAGFYVTIKNPDGTVGDTIDLDVSQCYPKTLTMHDTTHYQYTTVTYNWNYPGGDNIALENPEQTFGTPNDYIINLVVTTSFGCKDTIQDTLHLIGPVATLSVTDTIICLYDTVTIKMENMVDVFAWDWDFGDGTTEPNSSQDSLTHVYTSYPVGGTTKVKLIIYDPGLLCPTPREQFIKIYNVQAQFAINDTAVADTIDNTKCLNEATFIFTNQSSGIVDSLKWSFGDGAISAGGNQVHVYTDTGTFNVGLFVKGSPRENPAKTCVDTTYKQIIVYPLPTAAATGDDTCEGDAIQVFADATQGNGPYTYLWSPASGLENQADTNLQNPLAKPVSTTTFTVTVTDANGCTDTETAQVTIYEPPPQVTRDTTIIIGDAVPFTQFDLGSNYTYNWSPITTALTCTDCPNPTANPQEGTFYQVIIQDNIGCFSVTSSYDIKVLPKDTIDVPDAFTPGAEVNNKVYVNARNAWGVKRVLEFRIYNRWGQVVFEALDYDIKDDVGWDGTYLGKPQNMDTYVVYVKAQGYIPNKPPKEYKGYLTLIR